jgi:ComF family protein
VAKELIHRLKYERVRAGAKTIARLLADGYVANDEIITHVPTAGERVRARGYDQADLIARELSKQAGIPYLSLLNRLGKERQVGQKRADRKLQMKGAFYVRRQPLLVGKSVLLVDDVLTTGATCEAAARALKRAGARSVSAIVFAAV